MKRPTSPMCGADMASFRGQSVFFLICCYLPRSISIMADAFNNLSDAATSVMTLVGFRLAGKRADEDHPYGHGRIEYLTGLFVSVSIVLMGLELAKSSIGRILHPEAIGFSSAAAFILTASILVKFYMYFYNRALSVRIDSVALRSTAMDSLSDCVSTAVVLICQVLSLVKGWQLDGWCGLLVSAFILRTGLQTIMETADPLVGKAPDLDLIAGISERVLHTKWILDMHDLLVHDYGPGHIMVSLHAEIPSDLSLVKAHEIVDHLESQLDREFASMSTITRRSIFAEACSYTSKRWIPTRVFTTSASCAAARNR